MSFQVKLLNAHAKAPTKGSRLAAGFDIYASESLLLKAHARGVVKTGVALALPEGTYGRVAPRSGLAVKHGIDTLAGVIDADYRGELGVAVLNTGDADYEFKQGERVAQLVVERIWTGDVEVVETLDDTVRGAGRFGSTGTH